VLKGGKRMDIRINQTQPVQQTENKQNIQQTDGQFKFTLISNIEESELQTKLKGLLEEITAQGENIKKRRDIKEMKKYREMIKEFMNEITTRSHKFSRENFLDRRGRHRVYGMIRQVNSNLDELAAALLSEEQDSITILSKIDEIRGLLLDILA
jgi:uncharacterized protein YaaR (DUF327 family)